MRAERWLDRWVLVALAATALLGLLAPLASRFVTGFSVEEQHPLFILAGPGARDVPRAHPRHDGDPAGFARLDGDGDGQVDAAEAQAARDAFRPLMLLHARADGDRDGRVARAELAAGGDGLARTAASLGAGWFDELDADGDGGLGLIELVEGSRVLRLPSDWITRHDRGGDGRVSQDEYPGAPRTRRFWLGADNQGRDVLTRVLHGLRLSVLVGLAAALISFVIGVGVGAAAGFAGGWVDRLLMRAVDVLYGVPMLFVIIILVVVLGQGWWNLLVAIGLVQWLSLARVVRGEVARVKATDLYTSAWSLGLPTWRVLIRHVLPAALMPVLGFATLLVPAAILDEAFLSFLGLGVRPPTPSLGVLLVDGARVMGANPFSLAIPASALAIILLGFYRVGDMLRRRLGG
jgi:ABC-type dipeptide/oligopeptide/nickel transport system permease subunit